MDAMAKDKSRTQLQWDVWNRVIKSDCGLPIEPCIGNHDVWGWTKTKSEAIGDEPNYGKKWAMDALGISSPRGTCPSPWVKDSRARRARRMR